MRRFIFAILTSACLCGSAFAADFLPISGVSTTTENDLWPVANLIQGPGVGFNADEPHERTGGGADNLWVTADDAGFPSDYVEEVGKPVLTFDMGSDVEIGQISAWGYADSNTNGVSEFSLSFATAAEGAGGGSASAGPFVMAGDRALGTNDATLRNAFSFAPVTARYVDFEVIDNFFVAPGDGSVVDGSLAGGDRVGLGEVAFSVPEPSSISLLLFGLLAFGFRRRR